MLINHHMCMLTSIISCIWLYDKNLLFFCYSEARLFFKFKKYLRIDYFLFIKFFQLNSYRLKIEGESFIIKFLNYIKVDSVLLQVSRCHNFSKTPYSPVSTHLCVEHLPNSLLPIDPVVVVHSLQLLHLSLPLLICVSYRNLCLTVGNKQPFSLLYFCFLLFHGQAKDEPGEHHQPQQSQSSIYHQQFPLLSILATVLASLFCHHNGSVVLSSLKCQRSHDRFLDAQSNFPCFLQAMSLCMIPKECFKKQHDYSLLHQCASWYHEWRKTSYPVRLHF